MPSATPPRAGARGGRDFITIATWERLLDVYRQKPGQVNAAALKAGVNYRTSRKAWEQGLKVRLVNGQLVDKPPINTLVVAQHEAARAAREVMARTTPQPPAGPPMPPSAPAVAMAIASGQVPAAGVRELAEADALAALAEETRLVRVGRANVSGMMAATSNMLKGAVALSARVQAGLERFGVKAELQPGERPPPLTGEDLDEAINLMGKVAVMSKLTTECVRHVLTAERLLVGTPAAGKTPAGAPGIPDEATDEEARDELARLVPFLKKHGVLRVIPGGKSDEPAPPAEGAAG